jgi:hypothetical protein
MCPNCLTQIAMVFGGAGSAIALAATALRFRAVRAPDYAQSNTEENRS